jgi:hypothetical protein
VDLPRPLDFLSGFTYYFYYFVILALALDLDFDLDLNFYFYLLISSFFLTAPPLIYFLPFLNVLSLKFLN